MATTHATLDRDLDQPPGRGRPPTGRSSLLANGVRNRGRMAFGVFVIAAAGLAVAVLYSDVGARHAVLALRRPVAVGAPIKAADLTVVRVSLDPGVQVVPATDRANVVGRVAGVALVPGTLLSPRQFGAGPTLAAGRAVVGLALKPGQYPPGLLAGDPVLVVVTPSANLAAAADGSASPDAAVLRSRVTAVEPRSATDLSEIVSVEVAEADVPAVLAGASAGRISLARTGGTP